MEGELTLALNGRKFLLEGPSIITRRRHLLPNVLEGRSTSRDGLDDATQAATRFRDLFFQLPPCSPLFTVTAMAFGTIFLHINFNGRSGGRADPVAAPVAVAVAADSSKFALDPERNPNGQPRKSDFVARSTKEGMNAPNRSNARTCYLGEKQGKQVRDRSAADWLTRQFFRRRSTRLSPEGSAASPATRGTIGRRLRSAARWCGGPAA